MPKPVRRWLAWAVLMAGLAGIWGGATAQNVAVVRIDPAAGAYQAGDVFAVDVRIDRVIALYGVDVRLAFDPSKLRVVEPAVTPRTDLLSPPWMILFNQVDNSAGAIVYVGFMVNPQVPVSGSGAICSFHFQVLAAGTTEVVISEQTLSDINGELIPATTAGALYRVGHQVFLPLVLR